MDREQWAALKDVIRDLYINRNLKCKQVAAILREQHDDRVRERTLQRHLKEWGFIKGSHFELLPNAVPWQSQELVDLIAEMFWQSKTDSQIFKELQARGHTDVSQRQIRSIRTRRRLFRKSQLDAQGVLTYLDNESAMLESLPSIRKLVKFFREDRRIWVTRDVCNEAVNLAKLRNKGDTEVVNRDMPETDLIPVPVQTVEIV